MVCAEKATTKVKDLWENYKRSKNISLRNELVSYYTYLVRYIVNRFPPTYSPLYDHDDLFGYGMLGLLDAIDKYDLSKGVKFETYALTRIKGTILDYMRKLDWVPRSIRQKAKNISEICGKLEGELKRAATDMEISSALGISKEEYWETIQQIGQANIIYLEEEILNSISGEDNKRLLDFISDVDGQDPLTFIQVEETKQLLAESIRSLPEKERLVITMYYYEGLTLKEIGLVMNLSESRISQLHTKAIMRMRGKLSKYKMKASL
jgi:RNA polymerase sigma factor for flagellar operon FliA